jgi:hypothetical protein
MPAFVPIGGYLELLSGCVFNTLSSMIIYKIKESYRNQSYAGIVSLDRFTEVWGWKGQIDFDAGIHPLLANRTFNTALEAENHMRQSVHRCIDNRLG